MAKCAVLGLLSIAPAAAALLATVTGSHAVGMLAGWVASVVLPAGLAFALTLAVSGLTAGNDPPDGGTRERAPGD